MFSNFQRHVFTACIQCIYMLANSNTMAISSTDPQCSAMFHVWQPGQDAQQMIRDVNTKIDNLTSFTKVEVFQMKAHLSEELARVNNWTHALEKRVFQIQIDRMDDEVIQMKFSASSNKVKMQLDRVNRRVSELERSLYDIETKVRGESGGDSSPPDHTRPQQQGVSLDLGLMLQNSVSDLKSEWILLKRDIEFLKKELATVTVRQAELTNDTVSLKLSLGVTQASNRRLETRFLTVAGQQDKLDSKIEEILTDTTNTNRKLEEYRLDVTHRRSNLNEIQARLVAVERDLGDIQLKLATAPTPQTLPAVRHDDSRQTVHLTGPERLQGTHGKVGGVGQLGKDGLQQERTFPSDCHDIYQSGLMVSSVYQIRVQGSRYITPVYCEMINNTGYTLIQRRIDGSLSFNRGWSEYKQGFGNPYAELWAGNEFIHLISSQKKYALRIDFWDWDGEQYFAEYSQFYVESEKDHYRLFVGGFTGSAGDSLSYHNMMAFSTEDVDNDLHERHCAAENKSGWWYSSCFYSQLNGRYHTAWYSKTNYADGIVWYTLKDNEFYSLKKVEMKLKPLPV
ncbi:hypothetical protein EGW08_000704 [Elysia chlorotica]|uniref:Fibrinogen C-terminal domain-containing protein n=1 Tax=Elysia chlorotica TaxID=188477 RepID=A0A3S1BUI4_ELYCH|nr:hypothetical protein EGW08_000704 [Elysia chlorotica]